MILAVGDADANAAALFLALALSSSECSSNDNAKMSFPFAFTIFGAPCREVSNNRSPNSVLPHPSAPAHPSPYISSSLLTRYRGSPAGVPSIKGWFSVAVLTDGIGHECAGELTY